MNRSVWFFIIIVSIIILSLGYLVYTGSNTPGKLDQFAKCLGEKGVRFYGAFWCPHCQEQKKLFGTSDRYLPYIECSSPDGKVQLEICRQKNIDGYPTWEFPEGSRSAGVLKLNELSERSDCSLPE